MARILIEGSSTAYGLWGGKDGGWADRLKTDLLAEPDRTKYTTVINLSTPLREVDVIEKSLPENARIYAGRSAARIGIFMLGMNESRRINGQHAVPPETFRQAVGRISTISHDFGYAAIFLGMPPIDASRITYVSSQYTEESRRLYQDIVQEVAKENDDLYIDLETELSVQFPDPNTILDGDGMHVNSIGHAAIHEIIAPVVKEKLADMRL